MNEKEIKLKIKEQGWIRINTMFELLGSPKEHVEKVIKGYIEEIRKNKEFIIITKEEYGDTVEKEGGLWSVFAECEMIIKNLDTITWLCINFMPASIEIIEPTKFNIDARELVNWTNDLLSKLHEVGASTRQSTSERDMLLKNINALLRNFILSSLRSGPLAAEDISKYIGVPAKELLPLFDAMVKEKSIKKQGEKYSRA
ncbi:MAG: hypothetical protein V1659_05085 [Candidatus Woesearchaeota archaeon]